MARSFAKMCGAAIIFAASTSFIAAAQAKTLCTVLADAASEKIIEQNGDCETRVTPASTFKIAISLMGYDSGFLRDEHTPAIPFREGYTDWNPAWRVTTDPASWIKNSVVWYSQQITQRLGEDRFRNYASAFHYGNEDVSGDAGKHNGLMRAWISSSLKISPLEQAAFLRALVRRHLPVTPLAFEMTDKITTLGETADGWRINGKTGTGFPINTDGSEDKAHAYGWFVGWATKDNRAIVFVRLIQEDKQEPVSAGLRAREAFTKELTSLLPSL
jgi:beta-lactamase class D